jgi:hypothetical protein
VQNTIDLSYYTLFTGDVIYFRRIVNPLIHWNKHIIDIQTSLEFSYANQLLRWRNG